VPPLPPLEDELDSLSQADRLRTCHLIDGSSRLHATHDGRPVVTFCSNDYLGLANHPALLAAATAAGARYGFGAGASRLVSGELSPHRELEQALAALVTLPAALLFSTGYQANLAVVTSLAGPQDLIVSDEANHASLIDGARLSRARIAIYRHCDAAAAGDALAGGPAFRRRLLLTESLFSMDGDRAPLARLAELARQHRATLVVDEAHALGALGPGGGGLCRQTGVVPDILVGTLGKAFGCFGGFVAGSTTLRSYLVNRARTFIYTTAPPPLMAAAALAGVTLASGPEGKARRARLAANVDRLTAQLSPLPSAARPADEQTGGPIFPIRLGSDPRALRVSQQLLERGLFVPAIRPPTVPEGTARLRVTVSADHQAAEIDRLGDALREAIH
jgi:8-amino-7-oxononanoate synthase